MKRLLLLLAVLNSFIAHAQKEVETAMMSGIVLNEQNKLAPDAIIKISRKKVAHEVRVGEDGMYYSPLLPVGNYLVDIYVGSKYYTARKLQLEAPSEETVYYNFRLKKDGVAELYKDKYDPLERLKAGERVPQGGR